LDERTLRLPLERLLLLEEDLLPDEEDPLLLLLERELFLELDLRLDFDLIALRILFLP
jgi:hypothetical protein